ncbi:hypothetical protein [Mesobacillus stamsii]|uniref:Uncharacterized protein n=1 Tax=Mesobacillus stamsii TaxID=225347 RepID=A0ABU0FS01_9BACI|nr:hypothetical protein [Mesobacillus stamsii]MDQ0412699.1 hypothetical protein [Mesobacillus stamsii]
MGEKAFEGTILEGRERRYTILNERDIAKYAGKNQADLMNEAIDDVLREVETGREQEGKKPFNSYVVINVDEPYIDEIIAVMKRHGHWEEK